MTARYAIYFAPRSDSLLWQLGCLWHGRDPWSGAFHMPGLPEGLTRQRYEEIVDQARGYGFHATLKPPFYLVSSATEGALIAQMAEFARRIAPFVAPALEVSRMDGFLALTLTSGSAELSDLCARCVAEFDRFRAPISQQELARRRKVGLTPRQDELLVKWGYPYVMSEWRFHMTLTASLKEPECGLVEKQLAGMFRRVTAAPLYVDRIALFKQEMPDRPFAVSKWFPFGIE